MYKSNSLWDQEQDRYDSSIANEIGGGYNSNDKYSSDDKYKGESSGNYNSNEEQEEQKKEEKSEFEQTVDENLPKKNEEKEEENPWEVGRKAVANEIKQGMGNVKKEVNKKTKSSIEEAIAKAIKEEKEVIHLD